MSPTAERRADRAAALAIFCLLLGLYTLVCSGLPDNPDAEVEFQTTRSLARHASLALADTPEAAAIVAARFDVAPGGPRRPGRWYGWFGVGQALAAVPLYFAGELAARAFPGVEARHAGSFAYGSPRSEYWEHLAVGWRNPLLAAATAGLLVLAALRLGASRRSACLAALLFGTATFALAQARSTLSDVQATFCLCLAFERWLAYRAAPRNVTLALAAAALAAGVLTRVALAPAALAVAIVLAVRLGAQRAGARAWSAFLAPLALGAALFFLANFLRFGSALETGYGAALGSGTFFSYTPHLGLAGLLVAPGKGLVWMAPLVCLAPLGFAAARARGERAWPWLAAAVALALALPVACTATWHGAWTYGPRYLLPCLPLVWPAVALALDRARAHAALRAAAVLLALLGLATSLPAVLVDPMTELDLAVQAARVEWPDPGGADERDRDAARFLTLQWDWRFAAPWAHWRIAQARARGAHDVYSSRALFGTRSDARLEPGHERERGWRHLAWIDLRERLDGPAWIFPLGAAACFAAAALLWRRRGRELAARPASGRAAAGAQAAGLPPR